MGVEAHPVPWEALAREAGFDPAATESAARYAFKYCAREISVLRAALQQARADSAEHQSRLRAENERLRRGLSAAVRAADLALFVIRKQGVMPNSSWQAGFNKDLDTARKVLEDGK